MQQYTAILSVFMCGTGGRNATEDFVSCVAEKLAVIMDDMELYIFYCVKNI
jgi:hypothetical protein